MRYFFVSASIFFVIYTTIYGIIKAGEMVFGSGATIASFILGGFFGIIFWICLRIVWYWISIRSDKQKQLRRSRRLEIDEMLEQFNFKVANARTEFDLDLANTFLDRREREIKEKYG